MQRFQRIFKVATIRICVDRHSFEGCAQQVFVKIRKNLVLFVWFSSDEHFYYWTRKTWRKKLIFEKIYAHTQHLHCLSQKWSHLLWYMRSIDCKIQKKSWQFMDIHPNGLCNAMQCNSICTDIVYGLKAIPCPTQHSITLPCCSFVTRAYCDEWIFCSTVHRSCLLCSRAEEFKRGMQVCNAFALEWQVPTRDI